MCTNGKCNNSHPPFCLPSEPNIAERPDYEKNINSLSMHGTSNMKTADSSLHNLDIEAYKFYDRAHRLYYAALLTRCYT